MQYYKQQMRRRIESAVSSGVDTPGDVQVVPHGSVPDKARATVDFISGETLDFSKIRDHVDSRALPGTQTKVSAQMVSTPTRLHGQECILKLNPPKYPHLIQNEYAHLVAAKILKLPVATAELVTDQSGEFGLLVTRFDRTSQGLSRGLEDAAQIMGIYPSIKYEVSTEDLIHAVAFEATASMVAKRNLYLQFAFAWLTGNGDLHAKNVSLIAADNGPGWSISPLYDLPSTYIYDDTTLALPIKGRRKKLRQRDWDKLPFTGSTLSGLKRKLRGVGPNWRKKPTDTLGLGHSYFSRSVSKMVLSKSEEPVLKDRRSSQVMMIECGVSTKRPTPILPDTHSLALSRGRHHHERHWPPNSGAGPRCRRGHRPRSHVVPQLSAVKNAAAEASLRAVEQSIRACGGAAYYQGHELSRLYRDALAGLFQPSDQESLHGAWAQAMLGPVEGV